MNRMKKLKIFDDKASVLMKQISQKPTKLQENMFMMPGFFVQTKCQENTINSWSFVRSCWGGQRKNR